MNITEQSAAIMAAETVEKNSPYFYTFSELAYFLNRRVKKKWDIVIAVSGMEGMGKTTLALLTGGAVAVKNPAVPFELDKNVLYSPVVETLEDKIHALPPCSVVAVDEAIKVLYKMGWQSRVQIFVNTLYNVCRKEQKISILAIPSFTDLNTYFRKRRVYIRMELVARGYAVLLGREDGPFIEDGWHEKEAQQTWEKVTKGMNVLQIDTRTKVNIMRNSRNYIGELTFPMLAPEVEAEYMRLGQQEQFTYAGFTKTGAGSAVGFREKKQQEHLVNMLSWEYEHNQKSCTELARICGLSTNRVIDLLKEKGVTIRQGSPKHAIMQ